MSKRYKNAFRFRFTLLLVLIVGIILSGCNNNTLFTNLSSSQTGIEFANMLPEKEQLNILYHINYYNGGGVAMGDINNDGLTDIFFTANTRGGNKLYLNKGDLNFEDITGAAGVAGTSDWCSGVTMVDINGDGYLDIYVSAVSGKLGLKGHNLLYINNGPSASESGSGSSAITFTESAATYGLDITSFAQQAAFFDYDHDGDLDCFVLNQSEHPFSYILDTSHRKDYDSLSGDRLLRNDLNTSGRFTDVSKESGIWRSKLGFGLGLGIADINNDGWDDIYISNDFHENDYYYVNQKNGTFKDEGPEHFRHYSRFSMGNDIADYNNDGQLDVVTVDMLPPDEKTLKSYGSDEQFDIYKQKITSNGFQAQFSKNCLQRNNGNGSSFSEISLMSGVSATDWSWSPLFADFDNDGIKDLMITSGIPKRPVDLDYVMFISNLAVQRKMNATENMDQMALEKIPDGASHTFLFKGSAQGRFADVSKDWGTEKLKGYFNGAAYADLDNDGDLDIVINAINAKAVVYRNNSKPKNHLSIKFAGDRLNTIGIGAKAYLFSKNGIQYQQLMLTRGFQSSSEPRLHFGLDSLKEVDSLLIVWPNQQYQLLHHVAAGKELVLNQKDARGIFDYAAFFPSQKEAFADITGDVNQTWSHHENNFTDFNSQYLIPHKQSTRGPKLAVADVNNDGLEDIYACGAKAQPGCLMLQTTAGKFVATETDLFSKFAGYEDTDAVFFDADGDGDQDLLVTSGGNELLDGDSLLADRLYLNNGSGHFTYSKDALPMLLSNKSTIAVSDIDHDGDMDIFLGGLAHARKYGYPQSSYLLLNNGKGKFQPASAATIRLKDIGIVTTSVFADLNNDGWNDLVVTGEWMPIKIFMNNKGTFHLTDIQNSTGLWQTVTVADVNGDGFKDILAGNWGLNSKLYATAKGPLKLYVKDFDNNGSIEQVMAYNLNGDEYPFLSKVELERSIPLLKKAYVTYSEVAGKTVDFIFFDLFKDYLELKAETLASAYFLNDGKNNFTIKQLPAELQVAPVFSFVENNAGGQKAFIGAGNFYGVIPYEGRYDALLPTGFSMQPGDEAVSKSLGTLLPGGEVRDMKWVRNGNGDSILVIARNDRPLTFFKPI